ncbi:nucleocapsid [Rio Claro virus]|uniref:Nucleoprotein n=1 Tax=Rio Claro virus TaxID=2848418 RepID=I1T371_9VIRU|nr:nucleocapsid [Rio Claro virus]AEL29688.1 nucleocapsid [Rio Claro virus]
MSDYERIAVEFAADIPSNEVIQEWVEAFAYQGFDAAHVLKRLIECGGNNWKEDAKKLIVIAITRGNKPDKIMEKMSEEGKKAFKVLKDRYRLQGGNPGRSDLTLSRIATALAGWTCQACVVVGEYLPVTIGTMRSISDNYPGAMMHPCFAGLIDRSLPEDTKLVIINAFCLFMVHFTKVINPRMRSSPVSEVVNSFRQPMLAAINSNFLNSDQRKGFLKSLGILDANLQPTAPVRAAARAYELLA